MKLTTAKTLTSSRGHWVAIGKGHGENMASPQILLLIGRDAITPLANLSWSIHRETRPMYSMGYSQPEAFSRGRQSIAGTFTSPVTQKEQTYKILAMGNDLLSGMMLEGVHLIQGAINQTYSGFTEEVTFVANSVWHWGKPL